MSKPAKNKDKGATYRLGVAQYKLIKVDDIKSHKVQVIGNHCSERGLVGWMQGFGEKPDV